MSDSLLRTLGQALDEQTNRLARLDLAYRGEQPTAWLAPEARTALGDRMTRLAVNVPRLVVTSLAERLRVVGLRRDGVADPALWAIWRANALDDLSPAAHREALRFGRCYLIVWAGPDGSPRITVESPRQVIAVRDPATRQITAALKRWEIPRAGQVAYVYEADRITRWTTESPGAPADTAAWTAGPTIPNPLGVPPVVGMVNGDGILDTHGVSEMADVLDLTDALNKITADMMVTSEFFARPRRWATGIEVPLDDDGNPVNPFASDADRTWVAEPADAHLGQFAAADLGAYEAATRVIVQAIMAVSGLPAHYVGVLHDNPTSADSERAAEAALTARAETKQRMFGRAWEQAAALAVGVRDGVDPTGVDVSVQWADAASRSDAQEADAVTKLVQAGVLPVSAALERLGYTADDIARIRTALRSEALDKAASATVDQLMP